MVFVDMPFVLDSPEVELVSDSRVLDWRLVGFNILLEMTGRSSAVPIAPLLCRDSRLFARLSNRSVPVVRACLSTLFKNIFYLKELLRSPLEMPACLWEVFLGDVFF